MWEVEFFHRDDPSVDLTDWRMTLPELPAIGDHLSLECPKPDNDRFYRVVEVVRRLSAETDYLSAAIFLAEPYWALAEQVPILSHHLKSFQGQKKND